MKRVHAGCGIRNPWMGWTWMFLGLAIIISLPVNILLQTLWGLAAYTPWVVAMIGTGVWSWRHRPSEMYRTWYP